MEKFLPEFVYGATDGTVTTFAIVAGAIGANLSRTAVLVIGIASVLADGYSMGVSNYLSESARHEQEGMPQTSIKGHTPLATAIATFVSFVAMGTLPLIPFILTPRITQTVIYLSLFVALAVFACIGYLRGIVTKREYPLVTSLESFLVGGSTAIIAYVIGVVVGHP